MSLRRVIMLTWRAKLVVTYGSWHSLVIAVYSIILRATGYIAVVTDRQSHKVLLICVPCIHNITQLSDNNTRGQDTDNKDHTDSGKQPNTHHAHPP